MIHFVWVPLLMPFLAVRVARRVAHALSPRRAASLLTAVALVSATGGSAAPRCWSFRARRTFRSSLLLGELLEPPARHSSRP